MKLPKKISIILFLVLILILTINLHSQPYWTPQTSNTFENLKCVHFVNAYTGIACGYGVILRTTNGGNNWVTTYNGNNWYNAVRFKDANTVYMDGDNWTLLKSTNGGLNWLNVTYLGDSPRRIFIFGDTVIVGCVSRIVRSTDNGATWSTITPLTHSGYDFSFINSKTGWSFISQLLPPPNPENYLYNYITRTTDGGVTWVTVNNVISTFMPLYESVSFSSQNTGYICGYYGSCKKTTDGGYTWNSLNYVGYKIYAFNDDTVFASGTSYPTLINRTTNGGLNWKADTVDPGGKGIKSIFMLDPNTGWAVGDSGKILVTSTALIGIANYNKEFPEFFRLSQNYPNPFNPSTTIRFSVVKQENVKLTVFDAQGQEKRTLVNKNLNPGNYEINWDASEESSGVYFYMISTPSFSETKKMLLIK